jgi:succinyl-diaminopimelate desuccinylase
MPAPSTAEEQQTVELLRELVRTNSYNPPGREDAVARIVAEHARAWGLRAELAPLAEGRSNLLVSLPDEADGPTLLFCGHLDTVPPGDQPWEHDPLSADLVDGLLHGRGTVDMKGGLVAMLAAMRSRADQGRRLRGRLRLVGLVGEEVDCFGAKSFLESGGMRGVDWLVVGEPTNLDVVVAHRGALWLELTAHGKTAHGSMPHLGVNAIDHLIELLRGLRGLPFEYTPHALLTPPTMSVGTIHGGVKTNVVPDRCQATVDLRTLPGQRHDEIVDAVLSLADRHEEDAPGLRLEVRVANDLPPVETSADAPLARAFQAAVAEATGARPRVRGVSYYTDASVLQPPTGVPTVIFGPGDERLCHQPDEQIEVGQVLAAARCYGALAGSLLAPGPL